MYALDEIKADQALFRQMVETQQAYRPLYVKIKLIFGCNLMCVMCNHWRTRREAPLSIERFLEIIDELAELGCRKIHFSGGEALLRPQIVSLVERASVRGIRVTLTTNGTLVDKDNAKALIAAGLRGVNISIDSPEKKIHDQIRGVPGSWKLACRAVRYFRRYSHKGKLTIRINTVVSHSNYLSLVELPALASDLGVDALNLIPVDDHCGEYLSLSHKHIGLFNTLIAPVLAKDSLRLGLLEREDQAYIFGKTPAAVKLGRRGEYAYGWYNGHPCFAPWTHALVDFNGLVYVCCMTREQTQPLGDLHTQSFSEIWHGEAYHQVRGKMFPASLDACRRCDDFIDQNRRLYQLLRKSQVESGV
ncbi:MAG TPA: radical SAM protein [Anaerolineales bacterium]|nr:radical SAM protein [Anaerolineales bacterium]